MNPIDKLAEYQKAATLLPPRYLLWPLYGAGLENMGRDGKPIEVELPVCGSDQLIVRHDAVGLCFSDTKVINQGQAHPRIYRDMRAEPVVLGHEISMTVVQVGENLRGQYKIGDRLSIQADVYTGGVNLAYGYMIQGGLSQYNLIDQRIIASDFGNMLLPLAPGMGYAESALAEPWACVVAAYRQEYRTKVLNAGTLWIIGPGEGLPYTFSAGFDAKSHPARVLLSDVPLELAAWLRIRAAELGVEFVGVADIHNPPVEQVDDIILLGAHPDRVEQASPRLARGGVFAVLANQPMPRKVRLDIGRVHYDHWVYTGSTGSDLAGAYLPRLRSTLKPGGSVWFAGAGGPIGRMHVQRAIQFADPPAVIVCTDISDMRLEDLCTAFNAEAAARGIQFVCLNPTRADEYAAGMAPFFARGFDDVVVLAPVPAVIADCASHAAPGGTINVFAGVGRGTMVEMELSDAYLKGVRAIGQSGSELSDMLFTLGKAANGELSTNRSVAAVGSLSAARDGLTAVKETTYPGKVVIYPNIGDFPLTALPDLKHVLPNVYALLQDGREWTNAAEAEFLRQTLP